MSVTETKQAILLRVSRRPSFEIVPAHAIALFDHIIERDESEAVTECGDDSWARIYFFKERVLAATASDLRGQIAGQFHEYIAALMRNDGVEVDPYGFDNVPNYGGEARAQRDAYLACTASLA
jgi:hypothetical protein